MTKIVHDCDNRRGAQPLIILLAFFASGFAALLYQTIWQRLLTLFSGADVHAATIVVAAFMAGLGFGHLAGAHGADRFKWATRVRLFALCEIAIAAFALCSAWLYYDVLYEHVGATQISRSVLAVVVFAVTLVPTFLMGLSLPLLATQPAAARGSAATWIARLYGWNAVGAGCGALVTVRFLFRWFDLRTNLQIGAGLSVACGLLALVAARVGRPCAERVVVETGPVDPPAATIGFAFPSWLLIYAVTGFIALSLEIVWFRAIGVMLKSSGMTFGRLLAIYLAGVGLGALAATTRFVARLPPTVTFLVAQAAVPVWPAASFSALMLTPLRGSLLGPAAPYYSWWLIFPSTFLMGLTFGVLQRAVQTDRAAVGRRIGWLQTANIAGATLGAVATTIWLLGAFGTAGTLRAIVLCALLFPILLARRDRDRRRLAALTAGGVIAAAALLPGNTRFWAAVYSASLDRVIVGEDGSGVVALRLDDDRTRVFVNGTSQSWLPYQGVHTALGALPALLHPNPERIAVVGLGSGDTVFAAGVRSETRRIDSIEIMAQQRPALRRLAAMSIYPALERMLGDARIRYEVADGRAFLHRTPNLYDVIEADLVYPDMASAGNLYSIEYFRLMKARLKPSGLAVTWLPTLRTQAGFRSAFGHVLEIGDIGIGSESPLPSDLSVIRDRLRQPSVLRYYKDAGIDIASELAPFLAKTAIRFQPTDDRGDLGDVNLDLFPRDEFGARKHRVTATGDRF